MYSWSSCYDCLLWNPGIILKLLLWRNVFSVPKIVLSVDMSIFVSRSSFIQRWSLKNLQYKSLWSIHMLVLYKKQKIEVSLGIDNTDWKTMYWPTEHAHEETQPSLPIEAAAGLCRSGLSSWISCGSTWVHTPEHGGDSLSRDCHCHVVQELAWNKNTYCCYHHRCFKMIVGDQWDK